MKGSEFGGDDMSTVMTALLTRAIAFVADCRVHDALGDYPHVGDLQWMLHNSASVLDATNWCFWQNAVGQDVGLGITDDDAITVIVHPHATDPFALKLEIRAWAIDRVREMFLADGDDLCRVWETVASDDWRMIQQVTDEGCGQHDFYMLQYRRSLLEPLPELLLPSGFRVSHVAGEGEVARRAALHRDSFLPYSSKTLDEAMIKYRRARQMPGYDSTLDLVIVAPDGEWAAGGICWVDERNKVELFEPIGTRPAYRRQGLARALMVAGLWELRQRGMVEAWVGANHPGTSGDRIPVEFTSSRHVFEQVGFKVVRKLFTYYKDC